MNNAGYEPPIKLFGQNVYGATNALLNFYYQAGYS
jgi:hypothetical protein